MQLFQSWMAIVMVMWSRIITRDHTKTVLMSLFLESLFLAWNKKKIAYEFSQLVALRKYKQKISIHSFVKNHSSRLE